jgi:hypothetical protein
MGITTDNASNNSTFINSLSSWANENVVHFNKKEQHIRCFAHSINLSVKEALSCLENEISQVNLLITFVIFIDFLKD